MRGWHFHNVETYETLNLSYSALTTNNPKSTEETEQVDQLPDVTKM